MLFRGIFLLNFTVSNELKVRDCCEVRVILFGGHCVRTKGERERRRSVSTVSSASTDWTLAARREKPGRKMKMCWVPSASTHGGGRRAHSVVTNSRHPPTQTAARCLRLYLSIYYILVARVCQYFSIVSINQLCSWPFFYYYYLCLRMQSLKCVDYICIRMDALHVDQPER